MNFKRLTLSDLSHGYWSTWLFILTAHAIAYLPESIRFWLGSLFGKLLSSFKKPYHVAKRNLSSCFPELSEDEKTGLLKKYFKNQGQDLFESATIWCRNGFNLVDNQVEVDGLHHIEQVLSEKKGIILLASHFGNVDMGAMLMAYIGEKNKLYDFSATYRQQPNKVFNDFMTAGRKQYFKSLIPVNDSRSITRHLRNNEIVWYAPDMNVSGKNAEFIPFLGVPASTTLAISRLAKITQCRVLPYVHYRTSDKHHYQVKIFPALTDFPSPDPVADTLRINEFLGQRVSEKPESYWWILKRFRTRPQNEKSFY